LRVLKNRVPRRIFKPKTKELAGDWKGLHEEELCNLYASPNIIKLVKSRGMVWVGHVACVGDV